MQPIRRYGITLVETALAGIGSPLVAPDHPTENPTVQRGRDPISTRVPP